MAQPTELTLPAMGGSFNYKAYPQGHLTDEQTLELFELAHSEVKRIENKFTDFKDSPFNKINQMAGIAPCPVDQEIIDLVLKSFEISKLSSGLFDISFASVGHRWRHYVKEKKPFPSQERQELEKLIDYRKIQVDLKKNTIYLPHPKMRIGLGGIGKGHAVDRAFKVLRENRMVNFYINGSGDIRVHSSQDAPRPWKIGIRNPFNKDPNISVGMIQISNQSASTSGSYVQYNDADKNDHHIIRKGHQELNIVSATVIHDTCLMTDTLGTILMTLSPQKAVQFLNKLKVSGILIDETGKSHLSALALQQFGK